MKVEDEMDRLMKLIGTPRKPRIFCRKCGAPENAKNKPLEKICDPLEVFDLKPEMLRRDGWLKLEYRQ